MADFCKECSIEMFGIDTKDLVGLVTKQEVIQGEYATALCEHCGFILVDHEGNRIESLESELDKDEGESI